MDQNQSAYLALGLVLLALAVAVYLLPAIVASMRGHRQTGAIWVLTIFLGWSLVGWVVALVWACMNEPKTRAASSPLVLQPAPPITPVRSHAAAADDIARFAQLRDDGVITSDEFETRKRAILGA